MGASGRADVGFFQPELHEFLLKLQILIWSPAGGVVGFDMGSLEWLPGQAALCRGSCKEHSMPGTLFSAGAGPVAGSVGLEPFVKGVLKDCGGLRIDRLVVRRTPEGLCLDGVIRTSTGSADIADLVRAATGVTEVLNRLVVFHEDPLPPAEANGGIELPESWQG